MSTNLYAMLYKSGLCAGTGRHDTVVASTSGRATAEGVITAGRSAVAQFDARCATAADNYTQILTAAAASVTCLAIY